MTAKRAPAFQIPIELDASYAQTLPVFDLGVVPEKNNLPSFDRVNSLSDVLHVRPNHFILQ